MDHWRVGPVLGHVAARLGFLDRLTRRDHEPAGVHRRLHRALCVILDDAAVVRAEQVGGLRRLHRRRSGRPVEVFAHRDEGRAAMRTMPRPMVTRALLEQPPDRAFDLDRIADREELQHDRGAVFVGAGLDFFGFDDALARGRGDDGTEVGVGVAARFDQAERVALASDVFQHFVIFVHDGEPRWI